MFAKYELLLPVVAATFVGEFGDQLVIEYDFFGPALLLMELMLLGLVAGAELFGDQLDMAYDFFTAPDTPPPPARFDM